MLEVAESCASEFLLDCNAIEAHVSELLPDVLGEHIGPIDLSSEWSDFFLCELLSSFPELRSDLVQLEESIVEVFGLIGKGSIDNLDGGAAVFVMLEERLRDCGEHY